MRKFISYPVTENFQTNLIHFVKNCSRACVLRSNEWNGSENEMLAGIDYLDEIRCDENCFDALKKFYDKKKDWIFGFLSYDLKNDIEPSTRPSPNGRSSKEEDRLGFPLLHFFQPKYVFRLIPACPAGRPNAYPTRKGSKSIVEIYFLPEVSSEAEVKILFEEICSFDSSILPTIHPIAIGSSVRVSPRISKQKYIETIHKIKHHIQRGDIYEMNYCIEFYSEEASINPSEVFLALNETSQAPFSAFYRLDDNYLLCASPERFLKKEGRKIVSQPIKGTAPRGKTSEEDFLQKEKLANSIKDKSENVMIVDLVRNDLSRTCENVKVNELFGIYSFKQWHQMISTISGEMKPGVHFADVIENAFPMGSMTGAPKISAMNLINRYEKTPRGLYSGAVGYLTPPSPLSMWRGSGGEANFDFNVIIRSILYHSASNYLSFSVGSAITANSIPEEEYEECLVKARGMFEALDSQELMVNRYSLMGTAD